MVAQDIDSLAGSGMLASRSDPVGVGRDRMAGMREMRKEEEEEEEEERGARGDWS